MIMAIRPDRYWTRSCRVIGREDLVDDPKFNSFEARAENRVALRQILDEIFRTKTLEQWKVLLTGIPFAPVQSIKEAVNDPQARANDIFVAYDHPEQGRIEVIANPVKLSKHPATVRMPAPEFGQHTEEVLLEIGYDWENIARFKEQGIIA